MRILGTAFSALVLGATLALASSAHAAGDGAAAITERQALMKLGINPLVTDAFGA